MTILSTDLVKQFVESTHDETETKEPSRFYGTASVRPDGIYVILDGSTIPTPVSMATDAQTGDRVLVEIVNHQARVIQNINKSNSDIVAGRIEHDETGVFKELRVGKEYVDTLIASDITADSIVADRAKIEDLEADKADISSLTAIEANISDLQAADATINELIAGKADVSSLTAIEADISDLQAADATINELVAGKADVSSLTAIEANISDLQAADATITGELNAVKANIESLDAEFVQIDFANIDNAWLQEFYARSGIIKDLVIGESTVTGHLVGVTISGDLIEGNTVKADKLVIKGEDGLYYKLNIEGGSTVTEQLTKEMLQNGLDGNNIIANTITAEKISVDDLIAFDATIGGFNIGTNSIYSGVKDSINNTTRGIYLDTDGQVYFGDSTNYLKYYKDTDNTYKLEVSAKSILFGSTGSSVEDTINEIKSDATTAKADAAMAQTAASNAQSSIDNLEIGGRNILLNSGFKNNADGWDYPAYISEYVVKDGRKCAHINHSELNNIKFARQSILGKLEPNTQYIMSGWVFTENVVEGTTSFMCMFRHDGQYDNNGTTGWYTYGQKEFPVNAGKWTHVEWTFTTDSENTLNATSSDVYVYTKDMTGDIYFCDLKLEKGNKATDWTPAPEDVDAGIANAQTDINTLSDKTRSGFIEALSGNGFVQSTKTEDGGASEVVVYGKSEQLVTKQSANLCPKYDKWKLSGGAYIDGDYIVFPSNGATAVVDVHWKKASNILYFYIDSKRDSDDAASLIIKSDNGNGWATELQTDETTYSSSFGGNNVYGDTLLGMRYVRLTLMHYQSTTGSMRIKNFMVSSTNTSYVPFVPDSPSPEYPSEIQSVENPKVTVTAKNLLGGEALANVIVEKGGTKNLSNKTVQWQCSAVSNKSITESIKFKENTQYSLILYGKCLNDTSPYTNIRILYTDGSEQAGSVFKTAGEFSYAIVKSKAGKTIKDFSFSWYSQGTILEYEKCGLFEGVVNTEQFEPYKGNTATLSGIVLRATPDGTRDRILKDSNGLWKVERNIGYKTLNGADTEPWVRNSYYGYYWFAINIAAKWSGQQGYAYCNEFTEARDSSNIIDNSMANSSDCQYVIAGYTTTENGFFVRYDNITTISEWKEWLASNPVTVQYVLATPTYENLPDSIQEKLNALTTYNPITNVIVSDGVTPDIDVSFWTRDYYAKNAAENAAKVATNFLGYDSTNGLIIGNKISGTWSGYRSQILPGSFNVLDTSSTVLASFGPTTVIGEEAKANLHLTFNNFSMVDKDDNKFFEVGDLRDASGVATLSFYSKLYTDSNGVVTIDLHVNIDSIVSVVVTNVTISSSEYSIDGSCITITGLEKNVLRTFKITYTTLSSVPYLTFGTRNNSGKIGYFSSIRGDNLIASGFASHAEGSRSKSTADFSHSEGYNTQANGVYSHAEGNGTVADGDASHAEGKETKTFYAYSHAEGQLSYARGHCSHAEGFNTTASGYMAHAEGYITEAQGNHSHAEGDHTFAAGKCSHAEGYYTSAYSDYQHVSGKYNEEDYNDLYAFIIGNGTSEGEESNAFAVDWTGNVYMGLRDCHISDSGTDLSVSYGASTLDGLLAQAIINTFSYANAKEIFKKRGNHVNMNVKKLLQKILEKIG